MKKSIIITVILAVIAIVTNAQTVQYGPIRSYAYERTVELGYYGHSILDSLTITKEGDLYRISGKVTTFERTGTEVKYFSGLYSMKSNEDKKTVYETTGDFDTDRVSIYLDGNYIFVNILTFSSPIIPSKNFTEQNVTIIK